MGKFSRWFDKQSPDTQRYLNRIPIWSQNEMLSALFAGFVVGLAIGVVL